MKLTRIRIHNFRSMIDADIDIHDFIMLVGANNAGKSNFINALRCFYGDLKWTEDDLPKIKNAQIDESWVELSFRLTDDEWNTLADHYKDKVNTHRLILKRYFKGEKAKPKQSNIYAIVNDNECGIFYGANNISLSKCGKIIYIPALTKPEDQMKTSGPSPLRDLLNFILSNNIPQSSAYVKLSEAIEQLNRSGKEEKLLEAGGDFLNVLKQYIADQTIENNQKKEAKPLVYNAPDEDIAYQYEQFRYQLWLDPDRAAMFFADKVLLVEGASEKALFNYLLANDWNDLTKDRILIINALGKYNFHRFISLFEAYGIPHGILLDNDHNKTHHRVVNQLIRSRKNPFTQAEPFEFDGCLENFLGLELPNSAHQKPLQILQTLQNSEIRQEKLTELRKIFCTVLNIHTELTPLHTRYCVVGQAS